MQMPGGAARTNVEDAAFLEKIHVHIPGKDAQPLGFIRVWPEDFVVEEIGRDGSVATIDTPEEQAAVPERGMVNATVVKCNMASSAMTAELAKALGIRDTQIGHAGLKDEIAITAQRISVSGAEPSAVAAASSPSFFVKDVTSGQQLLPGHLRGNRFCLTVRFAEPLSPAAEAGLRDSLARVRRDGFPNFYMSQRFGPPRLGQERWGAMLLRGEEEAAVRAFLTELPQGGDPEISAIRATAAGRYGDWPAMAAAFRENPRPFRLELSILEVLSRGGRARDALKAVSWQAGMWVNVLNSYLFNQKISEALRSGGNLPDRLPLPLAPDGSGWNLYREGLAQLGLDERCIAAAGRLPYYRPPREAIDTFKRADLHAARLTSGALFISFSLDKGAYATAVLSQLVRLATGDAPASLTTERFDGRGALGFGSVVPVTNRFAEAISARKAPEEN